MTARAEIGFFSFTEVTDPAEHRAYNEWHQLDHLPEQYRLQGLILGRRWVSSPACSAARAFVSDRLAHVHYLTLYLMAAPVERTLEEFRSLGATLRAAGRFHEHRRARLSGPFARLDARAAPRVAVSADVIPFRPNLGVYVVVEDLAAQLGDARDTDPADRLLAQRGVAGVWRFEALPGYERLGWRPGRRRVTVCYLDEPPLEVCGTIADEVRELWESSREPEFAGPFETIVPWQWTWFE